MAGPPRLPVRVPPILAPCLVGAASFLVVAGPRPLDPANVGWVREGADSLTHYLGWAFFRNAPWALPLGLNPDYGLELGSSVLYSDSIPLLALLFKLLSPLLPEPFQYTGIWLLSCFVLQAVFAWMLVGLVTRDAWQRLAASALFVFAPPAVFRLAGHWALVAHWPVLAALYLLLRPDRRRQALWWALLTACGTLIHTYIFFMVLALWAGAWLGDVSFQRRTWPALALEAALVPGTALLALWQAGLFVVGSGKSMGGFGAFRMNLNALVNAYGWSYVLPTLPWREPDYEGFMFLGLGGLLLAVAALAASIARVARGELRPRREWVPLGLVLAGLTAVAASNDVGFGLHGVTYPVPPALEGPLGMMRASGRLFWPVFYAILLGIVTAVIRGYPARVSLAMLGAALVVQIVDTSAGWRGYQPRLQMRRAVQSPLISAFWYEAPQLYQRVRVLPPGNRTENWAVVSDYAQRLRLGTDAVYLARVDRDRLQDLLGRTHEMILQGSFEPGTFYVLQNEVAQAAPCVLDPERDQLAVVDNLWVLMPGWRARFGDRFAGQRRLRCPVLQPGDPPIDIVRRTDAVAVLTRGWSLPETWGTWSEGAESVISVRVAGRVSAVELALTSAKRPGPPLEVKVSVAGAPVGTWHITGGGEPQWYRVPLPDTGTLAPRRHWITLRYSDTRSPASLGASTDRRPIAVAVWRLRASR